VAISLQKGSNPNLSKTDPSLKQVLPGLGWETRSSDGVDFDLNASIFMVTESGRVRTDSDFIFYCQLRASCGSADHTGDNRTGEGDDDEALKIKLDQEPRASCHCQAGVGCDDSRGAETQGKNFGMVHNAFIRLSNSETNVEITCFDLSEDSSTETALVFGEVFRYGSEWKFKAVGHGCAGGLRALAIQHGVDVQ